MVERLGIFAREEIRGEPALNNLAPELQRMFATVKSVATSRTFTLNFFMSNPFNDDEFGFVTSLNVAAIFNARIFRYEKDAKCYNA